MTKVLKVPKVKPSLIRYGKNPTPGARIGQEYKGIQSVSGRVRVRGSGSS